MTGFLHVTGADFAAVAPEMVLCLAAALILLLDAFARPLRAFFPYVALLSLAIANLAGRDTAGIFFSGAVETTGFTRYMELVALGAVALAILGGAAMLERDKRNQGEFYALLLFSAAGLILMVRGGDLLVVFIGLELMSLCLYVLAAWYRDLSAATEAGLKYFLMGALASAFLLYGVATIYGRLGTTSFTRLQGIASAPGLVAFDTMLAAGILAVVAGLAFKIALVPFHGWAPDVYQGMTTPAVAFLSTAPKAGAVLVLARVLHALFPAGLGDPWRPLLAILAALSILFGNVVALSQRDLKRMLAYSGIAQMGYVAIGLATFTSDALEGVCVFLAGYLVTNAAAFLALGALSSGETEPKLLTDLSGLGRRRPLAATVLTLSMISLTGLPPTVGFIGKLLVFRAAVDGGLVPLTIIGVFGSLVSVGYYLRVVYHLWMKDPVREVSLVPDDILSGAAFILTAALMLFWGVFPRALLDVARQAAFALTGR
ncbi:MAG TPA: NADH-quinone oxidoreductase subunit N [Thermoanaerobaculia bacterium]|nr:NADH-quinone oxidoreductase subunit N [Thermoanaerobaculia bacterium]